MRGGKEGWGTGRGEKEGGDERPKCGRRGVKTGGGEEAKEESREEARS